MTATAENTCIDGAQESIAIAKRVRTRTRTRTGCWNCRRKRRKCDERRPICSNCLLKNESCHRGLKLSFRPENLQTLPSDHPSMRPPCGPGTTHISRIEIFDVTHEVIRDYWNEVRILANECNTSSPSTETVGRRAVSYLSSPLEDSSAAVIEPDDTQTISDLGADDGCPLPSFMLPMDTHDRPVCGIPLRSYEEAPSGAANLVDFSRSEQANPTLTRRLTPRTPLVDFPGTSFLDNLTYASTNSPDSSFNDGIFLPGSAYLELHSTLRSHMFDSARSIAPTRQHSPEYQAVPDETQENTPGNASFFAPREQASLISSLAPTPGMVELAQQEEYELWKNWTDEIGPWLDKFDNACHFGLTLPLLAKDHSHLRVSMLALSARQLERKDPKRSQEGSLALYQEAIHQLIPQLQTRTTATVASCVVLCVLEMMSCSPRMWRRHVEGCARMIESIGIDGFSGGVEQALFWCFARMDLCGGLISSTPTIILTRDWAPGQAFNEQIKQFRDSARFDMYACSAVFLCAKVLEILASEIIGTGWSELFAYLEDWYLNRPAELKPILELDAPDNDYSRPFPIILFSNGSAISSNQLYHTAAVLMLQKRPRESVLHQKPRSILWHARRICAISMSNTHHGSWTNSIQPLWIAGQIMSHPAEHRAILEMYDKIERETGWGAKWRAKDLKEYWGELDND